MQITFQLVSAVYLEDLKVFKPRPSESLLKSSDLFDDVAMPLLLTRLMTSRNLGLNLRRHSLVHIKGFTLVAVREGDKTAPNGGNSIKDELIAMAQEEEGLLL